MIKDYVKHMAYWKYWISINYVLLLISFSFTRLQVTQQQDLRLLIHRAYWMNNMFQVLQKFWGFVTWWFSFPGVFYILSNPTSNAHLRQWRSEMYPQEKRHEYNTLSFLNDRPDCKRFSLSSPHPNLLSAAGLGLGQET